MYREKNHGNKLENDLVQNEDEVRRRREMTIFLSF